MKKKTVVPSSMEDNIAVNAFQEVAFREMQLEMLTAVISELEHDDPHDRTLSPAKQVIYSAALSKLHRAYQNVFMWGCVLSENVRKRAALLAMEKLLTEHHCLINYVQKGLRIPVRWEIKEEKELKALIAKVREKVIKEGKNVK